MTLKEAFEILKHDRSKAIACRYDIVGCYAYYFFNGEHPKLFVRALKEELLSGFDDGRLISLTNWLPPEDPGTYPNSIELIPLENIFKQTGDIYDKRNSNT